MRVIAGTARRLPLKTPEGMDTRPTTDRIKETLFNMLQPSLSGAVFIDLYSGSGGIGACITENLRFTRLADRATVLRQDVLAALSGIHEKEADVIFMDPPYGLGYERAALAVLRDAPYVTGDTLVVIEAALDEDFGFLAELGFTLEKEKRYKTNKHVFCRRTTE